MLLEFGCGVFVDLVEVVKWYFLVAKKNDVLLLNWLGFFYEIGWGVKWNLKEVVKFYC